MIFIMYTHLFSVIRRHVKYQNVLFFGKICSKILLLGCFQEAGIPNQLIHFHNRVTDNAKIHENEENF